MPFVVPAVVAAGIGAAFATTPFLVAFATGLATNLIIGGALYLLADRGGSQNFNAAAQGRLQILRSPIAPRVLVYGETVISGTLVAYFATDSTNQRQVREQFNVPRLGPYAVTVANAWAFLADLSAYAVATITSANATTNQVNTALTKVVGAPASGQYAVVAGVYTFNADLAGKPVAIWYTYNSALAGKQWHHFVLALAGHQVDAIGEVFLDDVAIGALDANGLATGGQFAQEVKVKKYLGTATQAADADLIAATGGKWTANHRGQGVAYIILSLHRNPDVGTSVFGLTLPGQNIIGGQALFTGPLPNIKAYVRGKPVLDPRDGVTRWSNNAALCTRDYLTSADGIGSTAAEISDADTLAAANSCDERVAMAAYSNTFSADAASDYLTYGAAEQRIGLGDGVQVASSATLPAGLAAATTYYVIQARDGSQRAKLATTYANALAGTAIDITSAGSGTHTVSHIDQARYTCDGTVSLNAPPLDILGQLRTAMAGVVVWSMGGWRMFAGVYASPAVTLTRSDLRDKISVNARIQRKNLFNAVRGTYVDPAKGWQPGDYPPVRNATYAAQDGGEVLADVALPFTINAVRAQRIAKIQVERSRQQISVTMPCKLSALKLAVWDTVQLTFAEFGWSGKVFRVIVWELAQNGLGVDLTLQEEASASYAWNAGNATTLDPAPDTDLPRPFNVAMPGGFTATESLYKTSGSAGLKSRVTLSWSAPSDALVRAYQAEYKLSSAAMWTTLQQTSGLSVNIDDSAPGIYDYRVKALNIVGAPSLYAQIDAKEIYGLSAPPGNVQNLTVRAIGGQAMVILTQTVDLDVRQGGRLILRWSPKTAGASWNDGSLLSPPDSTSGPAGWPGDSVAVMAPLYGGTYLAKFRDSSGNYSVTETTFVVTEALLTGFATLATVTESPTFLGTRTNVAAPEGGLQLVGATLWDALGLVDGLGNIDSLGGIVSSGNYLFASTLNVGSVKTARLFPTIQSLASDTADNWDDRTTLIDTWGLVDGATIEDAEITLYVRTTTDDPTGAPTWGVWHPLPGPADYTFWGAQFRLDYVSGNPTHNRKVTTLSVAAKQ